MLKENQTQITVRHINLLDEHKYKIRDLSHKNIEALVCIEGIILRNSDLTPEMITGFFKCVNCNFTHEVDLENAVIQEPRSCSRCHRPDSMEFIHNLSTFVDKQFVKIQEKYEDIPEGETGQTITVVVTSDLVDSVRPGDKVQIVGIYRA